ncbi:hypothetical protein RISK_002856 [Rhodopirellula islandica]|uniref:Uncharacterized protein n=1 Tax=Rhodopirellula islandica TaxID=595434 RepID=A0A0J1EHR8_RHOIS|nr:hypothetical protein RISK_002856 [Rhodopirellula islandica]
MLAMIPITTMTTRISTSVKPAFDCLFGIIEKPQARIHNAPR